MNLGFSLLFSLISGLIIMVGGWIFSARKNWEAKYLDFFIALGAGFILAVALLDMIPQAFASSPYSMAFVILGYLVVHLFEHVLTPHFHFGEETHEHLISHTVSTSALVGLMVHNFFSGVAIGSGMLIDYKIGLIIFFGTILHKLPEGFTISSIMFASHHRRKYGVIGTILLAVSSILGTVLIYVFEMETWPIKDFALCISAGTFIHVATTDLIPSINDTGHRWLPLVVFLGVGLFLVSSLVIHH
jgi:zinc transporter ZupT